VQSVVKRQFELEEEYLRQRFRAGRVPLPQLPLIPLGINAADFRSDPEARQEMRARHGAGDDAFVVLTMGRFTVGEKANMVPLFQVLERLAAQSARPVHLWMTGWTANEKERDVHLRGAAEIAPSVTCQLLDGRDEEIRRKVWSGADVFTLPVDNIQETFGLVPVEAMSAGLPVVMPDWDGFRDTVVHGETGWLIPTWLAAPGQGRLLARRFLTGADDYLRYLVLTQQHTVIDQAAYLEAFRTLIDDPERGRQMGAAGAAHVRRNFDWSAVVPQYLALSEALAERRQRSRATTPKLASGPVSPVEVDPFDLYRAYPTASLTLDDHVAPAEPLSAERLAQLDQFNGRNLYSRRILPDATVLAIQNAVPAKGAKIAAVAKAVPHPDFHVLAALLFLAKHGAVQIQRRGGSGVTL